MDDLHILPPSISPVTNENPGETEQLEIRIEPPASKGELEESFSQKFSAASGVDDEPARRRKLRRHLSVLFSLALSAFILTTWLLVRYDTPFATFSSGPQEVVRAQLRALDRGELRPAYDMFSPRYRGQVSFDTWHQLWVTHWRMFHADVVRTDPPALTGPGVTLEIYLHGADDKDYRAHFTLVRSDGRWWIDDVHWAEEPDESDVSRT